MNGRQEKKTMDFKIDGETVDSVELKCLVISRGLKIGKPEAVPVHEKYYHRLSSGPTGRQTNVAV